MDKFRNLESSQKRPREISPFRGFETIESEPNVVSEPNDFNNHSEIKKLKKDIESLRVEMNNNFNSLKEMISSLQKKTNDPEYPSELV